MYDRGDFDVVVVERSTDGLHELCNDPAVQPSHECPVWVVMRATWLLPRRAGDWHHVRSGRIGTMRGLVGVAPSEIWSLEE